MNRGLFSRKGHTPLWQWVGLRMSALAVVTVIAIAVSMYIRYAIGDWLTLHHLPVDVRQTMLQLRVHPHQNEARLWALFARYYDVVDFLPGLANKDWLILAVMVAISIPLIVLCGLYASRPLSCQFSNVANAARKVSEGDFSTRASVVPGAPGELAELATNFNSMTAKLQQYERELRESSAMLAHELRTPLNAAMGRVQGMLDEVFPASPEQLQLVHRQLEQINRLVGDLHFLSLARAGQLVLESQEFRLKELIDERTSWAAPALQAADMLPQMAVPEDMLLFGDRDRIGQVLSILIDNAIRYAASGKSLRIKATRDDDNIIIEVSDRGPGVAQEALPRMVDRFWRADSSRARHSGGSGLGLSIASAICHAHGGSLEANNGKGGGLDVRVALPLKHASST
jgi:signal transduction histidine kinase